MREGQPRGGGSSGPRHGGAALVTAPWVPVRGEPSHRAEMVSQWLSGETVQVREARGAWLRGRGPDGYEGWVVGGGVLALTPEDAGAWSAAATLLSLGAAVRPGPAGAVHLPWGARAAPAGSVGTERRIRLADGREATALDPASLVAPEERARRFPATGEAVVATALSWLGVPYVWGGRTPWGADCSGFAQAVLGVHGAALPRDSHLQRDAGPDVALPAIVAGPGAPPSAEPGDLLFFAPGGGRISHVGISAGGSRLVHCSETNGVVTVDDLAGEGALERQLRESLVAATRPLGRG